jgi:hypothetical protein
MDRHLTYVAMTRHRDGAALYAGRDEFADLAALSARLGRSQAKETTLDYYAERRGIAGQLGVESQIEVPDLAQAQAMAPVPAAKKRDVEGRSEAASMPGEDSALALARSILAQSAAGEIDRSARQREPMPREIVPAVDPQVAAAIAQAKEAFQIERAVDEARAAFAADQAREIEAERFRLAQEIRQKEQVEAAQKLEQERGQSWGMEI